jgi:thiol-disulfide isomerase/thioredoxin
MLSSAVCVLPFVTMFGSARFPFVFAGIVALAMGAPAVSFCAPPDIPAPAIVKDIDGHAFRLFGPDDRATVLFFVADECPIVNSYMPEMNRIVAQYAPQKVAFFAVYSDPSVSSAAIRRHAEGFALHMPLIADKAHLLVRRAGATVTPEVAVFAPDGRLVYRGRIDDWYVDFGRRRTAPTQHYLREALDEVLRGAPVAVAQVPPIGCSIVP